MIDPVALAQALIRCPSVTPEEGGALDLLQQTLEEIGFVCHRLKFSEAGTADVDNLYARCGSGAPNFCFAGHTDVVPTGPLDAWNRGPFDAVVEDGVLYGRGAADMKGAIACFTAAAQRVLAAGRPSGSISLLITGDEEGPAINGTQKMLHWLKENGETLDVCLIGEPTNPERLGQMVKIGRRGSMNGRLTVHGIQGHTAYPHLADNPAHRLVAILNSLVMIPLDEGSAHFPPSTLQISTIDIGNPATNVIPGEARATFNIRFNDLHSSASLTKSLHEAIGAAIGQEGRYDLDLSVSGESFLTLPGPLSQLVCESIEAVLGNAPELSTTGGTSDARFIKDHCEIVEFGMVGQTMHKADEQARIEDLQNLRLIYEAVLRGYFNIA